VQKVTDSYLMDRDFKITDDGVIGKKILYGVIDEGGEGKSLRRHNRLVRGLEGEGG